VGGRDTNALRFVVAAITAMLALAACGRGSVSHPVSLEQIVNKTRHAGTARVDMRLASEPTLSGEATFGAGAYHLRRAAAGGVHALELVFVDGRTFGRFESDPWCDAGKSNLPSVLNLFTAGASAAPTNALTRVGSQAVRGVATTRYRYVLNGAAEDLWIGADDRIRRVLSGKTTVEFYDFGASTPPIVAPASLSSGSRFCRGLVASPTPGPQATGAQCEQRQRYIQAAIEVFRAIRNNPNARPTTDDLVNNSLADKQHVGTASIQYAPDGSPTVRC
jgi:hypothetical protein